MNDDDDPKKPLPRDRWADEAERAKEAKRVSQLLDAESGQPSDAPADDPSMMEVYGAPPPDDHDLAPVYGAPEDDQPSRPVATRVYGMPAPVYGMPATRRPAAEPAPKSGGSRLVMFVVGGLVAAAALLWWFTRS